MQETKCTQVGLINLDGYYTYEHVRSNKEGGGIAISALKQLHPAFVSNGGEEAEALTIDIHVQNMAITITSAYGPQESTNCETKDAFWKYLHEEAHKAKSYGKGYILQGDLNAWLGPVILPGDKHKQNRNGKLFSDFLRENKLTCVNSLPITQGLITRSRKCLNELKESTIDFYVVCERVLPFVLSMNIDNGKKHILTNFNNTNREGIAVHSDHFPLTMEVKLEAFPDKKKRIELLNFKDPAAQQIFKDMTSNTEVFTKCFNNVHNVSKSAQEWIGNVKSHCKKSFKKIRIRSRTIKPSGADKMITERNKLVKQGRLEESRKLEVKITDIIAEEGRTKAFMFKKYMNTDGSACLSEMWKVKKSLFPKKTPTLPAAKINFQGRIVSEPNELTKLLGEEY